MRTPPAECCETCRYWRKVMASDRYAPCRRYPPTLTGDRSPKARTYGESIMSATEYPFTSSGDWCGEFKPLDSPPPA